MNLTNDGSIYFDYTATKSGNIPIYQEEPFEAMVYFSLDGILFESGCFLIVYTSNSLEILGIS